MHMVRIEPLTTKVGGRCINHFTTDGCAIIVCIIFISFIVNFIFFKNICNKYIHNL
ncbi:hypothetical protein ACOSP7_004189 [Xanthoceras sorbifolium]